MTSGLSVTTPLGHDLEMTLDAQARIAIPRYGLPTGG